MSIDSSASDTKWYWAKKDSEERSGPIMWNQLKELAEAGELEPDDLVWRKGMENWNKAREIDGLANPDPPPSPSVEQAKDEESFGNGGKRVSTKVRSGENQKKATKGSNAENLGSKTHQKDKYIQKREINFASTGKRVVAYILDVSTLFVTIFISTAIVGAFSFGENITEPEEKALVGMLVLFLLAFGLLYFVYFHSYNKGSTLGKKLFDMKVVNEDGGTLSLRSAFFRYLIWVISHMLPILLIVSPVLAEISDEKQSLHDRAANSFVIEE